MKPQARCKPPSTNLHTGTLSVSLSWGGPSQELVDCLLRKTLMRSGWLTAHTGQEIQSKLFQGY